MATLFGTDLDNRISGAPEKDRIFGNGGHDRLDGKGQADDLYGGRDDDVIFGGSGADRLYGGDETGFGDLLFGGLHNDQIFGGAGDDHISGDDGRDTLAGGKGDDLNVGGRGDDLFQFRVSTDTQAGNDQIADFKIREGEADRINLGKRFDFGSLDTNGDGVIGLGDQHVGMVNVYESWNPSRGAIDLRLDLGAALGKAAGTETLTVMEASELSRGDLLFF